MKQNIAKILAVVLVISLCAVFFAACVPSDHTKAKANLEGNAYVTTVLENGSVLNLANADAALVATAYDVTLTGKCEYVVTGTSKDAKNKVSIYYFDNSKDASALKKAVAAKYKEAKAELKANLDAGKITQEQYDKSIETAKDSKYGASGKVFWFGTKAGVKAAG